MPDHRTPAPPWPCLHLVPGSVRVLLIVGLDDAAAVLAERPGRLVEGLRAAADLLSFHGLERDEDRLDELLPWAGAV
ncbi:MAG: hypothetical protein JNL30_06700 [Rubrivivax sp.]|nr:hypothetical protein [Rubrivivax sp.]